MTQKSHSSRERERRRMDNFIREKRETVAFLMSSENSRTNGYLLNLFSTFGYQYDQAALKPAVHHRRLSKEADDDVDWD